MIDAPVSSTPRPRSPRLARRRAEWPGEALDAARRLQRELDRWCREQGLSPRLNPLHAETAVREAWVDGDDGWSPVSVSVPLANPSALPDALPAWPADWRYRVAELERTGTTRAAAVRRARAEHRRQAAAAA